MTLQEHCMTLQDPSCIPISKTHSHGRAGDGDLYVTSESDSSAPPTNGLDICTFDRKLTDVVGAN
jgi:hypothetical protein